MTDAPPLAPESMLAHANALRALARALVRDTQEAEDLLQSTWLRALQARRAATAAGGLRAWLASVLRNEVRMRRRGAGRARDRERAAARSETQPPTVDVVVRLGVQRAVLDAVEALEPASRDVVYLRWFEDLPPRVIAARLGLSRRAVESRLRRALAQLRSRLDRSHHRQDWLGALCACAWPTPSPWMPVAAGALVLPTKTLLSVLAAGLGVLVFVTVYDFTSADRAPVSGGGAQPVPGTVESNEPVAERSNSPRAELEVAEPAAPAVAAEDLLRGRVLDQHAQPVPALRLRFVPKYRPDGQASCVSGEDGSFALPLPPGSGEVESADPQWATLLAAERTGSGEPVTVVVGLSRIVGGSVHGPDGSPIANTEVTLKLPDGFRARFDIPLHDSAECEWRAETDALGRFVLDRPPQLRDCVLTVRARNYAPHERTLGEHDEPAVRVVLQPLVSEAGEVCGVVLDAAGQPVGGAKVALGQRPFTTKADGAFRFVVDDPERERRLFAVAEGWRPTVLEREQQPGGQWPDLVELRLVDRPLAIEGVVLDAAGEPNPRAKVWVHDPTYFAVNGPTAVSAEHEMHREEVLWRRFETDSAGRFRIEGLLDREYELRAIEQGTTDLAIAPGVRAGSSGVVIGFRPGALLEHADGRIVDSAGLPAPGVSIRVARFAFTYHGGMGDQSYRCQEYGASARSDQDGRFVLTGVPRGGIELQLAGENLLTSSYEFPGDVVTSPIHIVVTRRCLVRIDVSGSPLATADSALVLDARGDALHFLRDAGNTRYVEGTTKLTEGRTEVLFVPDTARTIVLRSGGGEVGRLPVAPDAESIVIVRP